MKNLVVLPSPGKKERLKKMANEKEIVINTANIEAMKSEYAAIVAKRESLKAVWKPAYEQYKELGERKDFLARQLKGVELLTSEKVQVQKSLVAMVVARLLNTDGEGKEKHYTYWSDWAFKIGKKVLVAGSEWPTTWTYDSAKGKHYEWKVDSASRLDVLYVRYHFMKAIEKKMFVENGEVVVTLVDGSRVKFEDLEMEITGQ